MASQPLRRALVQALRRRAEAKVGIGATPMDYVEAWLRSGRTLRALAGDIEPDLGRPVSRKFVSFVCNRLTPDARSRVRTARLQGQPTRSDNPALATGRPPAVLNRAS
jgi:hypothetical protein